MSGTRSEILAQRIVAKLDDHQQVSEEILRRLVGLVSETVVNIDHGADRGLVELEQDISARYVASSAAQLEGFSLGACWGALEVLRAALESASESEMLLLCAEVVRKHLRLFQTVGEHPGITQGELADALGEKKSNFSQKLSRLGKYQMLLVSLVGKRKHLYLTRRGEESLRKVLVETGEQKAYGPMSNVTVRATNETEFAIDDNGLVRSYRQSVSFSMTKNDNAGFILFHGNEGRRVQPYTRYLERFLDARSAEHSWFDNRRN